MKKISVDFEKNTGKIKPMHAVNNGPVYKFAADQRVTNIDAFKDAGIPYVRTHDAAFYAEYGGEHAVDITAIFPDFDADPYDEASYDFACTDEYLRVIDLVGCKTFYRLGQKIEHYIKKYGTIPPKDFHKWAVICEHIIKHYNDGWANGFHYGIEYWEIWNEPDLDADDSDNKRTWGGTKLQFFEFYDIAATYLKKCFPTLKIGGPALAHDYAWAAEFLKQLRAPLDFFSWHIYANDPKRILERADRIRKMLDDNGYKNTESILNEWNYVKGWEGDEWLYSLRSEKSIKGAAFTAGTMAVCQQSDVDLLMYYDARPCAMNGLFNTDFVCDKLKGYYPFFMFNVLYQLGTAVDARSESGNVYVSAAKNENSGAVMVTYFDDDDDAPDAVVELDLSGFKGERELEYYILGKDHDCELFKKDVLDLEKNNCILEMPLYSSILIKIK